MNNNLNMINSFLNNYKLRIELYKNYEANVQQLRKVNINESKMLANLQKELAQLNNKFLEKVDDSNKLSTTFSIALKDLFEFLANFLVSEKLLLYDKITENEFNNLLLKYKKLNLNIEIDILKNILEDSNVINNNDKIKILDYFNHIKNVRFWMRPALVVPFISLILKYQSEFLPDVDKSIVVYCTLLFLFVFKIPDTIMDVFNIVIPIKLKF